MRLRENIFILLAFVAPRLTLDASNFWTGQNSIH